jgi:hypothetical protein
MARMKTILTALTLTGLLISSSAVRAEEVQREKNPAANVYKVTEAVVVRPLGMAATAAGGVLYLVTWPVSRATGNHKEMYKTLVKSPSQLAFGNRATTPREDLPQIAQHEVAPLPQRTAQK